jgi:hypothetical protein
MPFTIGPLPYNGVKDGYSGYLYDEEAAVLPLLAMDPARPDKNEVIQTTGKRAQVATLEVYADTAAERDAFVALMYTQTTHLDGTGEAVRNVTVVSAKPRIWLWSGGVPHWIVAFVLRTR